MAKKKILQPPKVTPSKEVISGIQKGSGSDVTRARQTGRTGEFTEEIPSMVAESKELAAKISSTPNAFPAHKNSLNNADSAIKSVKNNSKEWDMKKPFRLEEFHGNPPYRGEGLLPGDKTIGVNVIEDARIIERNHPAAGGGK